MWGGCTVIPTATVTKVLHQPFTYILRELTSYINCIQTHMPYFPRKLTKICKGLKLRYINIIKVVRQLNYMTTLRHNRAVTGNVNDTGFISTTKDNDFISITNLLL